jgi:transcriptional regulator with XRE-family HTH domain
MADDSQPDLYEARLKQELRLVVRRARDHMGLSQGAFATALGKHLGRSITQSQVSDWERGRNEPGASILLAVAEMANVTVDELRVGSGGALAARLDRIEETLERLVNEPPTRDGRRVLRSDIYGRIDAIEAEMRRVAALFAQLLGTLDRAGLMPDDADRQARGGARGAGPQ